MILLVFDAQYGNIIRNSVELNLFEGIYKDIVNRVYDYYDKYHEPPREVMPSLFDDVLEGDDKRKAYLYSKTIEHIYGAQESVNAKYTMDRINEYVREQELKLGIVEAAGILQRGGETAADEAEEALNKHLNKRLSVFDPGIFLGDLDKSLRFLDAEVDSFSMGIPELDKRNLGPARGQLHLLIGVYNRGKSWHLINLGKRALLSRRKVCHISLEMSEEEVIQRYYQTLFSMSKRMEKSVFSSIELDELDRIRNIEPLQSMPKLSLEDVDIRDKLKEKIFDWGKRLDRIIVKRFPTGTLTVRQLEAYLDNLEATERFVPDLLLVDYIDNMSIPLKDFRLALGRLVVDLRGIAVKRNLAVATVTQSNKEGAKSRKVSGVHVSEDWSKMATADVVLTYNQTEFENKLGLARLYVDKARGDKREFSVLITQNYDTGQFVIDSAYLTDSYWDIIDSGV